MRTHCKHGHEYTSENTLIRSDNGGRRCKTCKNQAEFNRYWSDGHGRVRVTQQTIETLYEKLEPDPSGCLIWTGFKNERGYGRVKYQGRKWLVHRLIWELAVGPITPGMTLDHQCHNQDPECRGGDLCLHRACCDLTHLREVPSGVNTLAGKTIPAEWARRTAEGGSRSRAEVWSQFGKH